MRLRKRLTDWSTARRSCRETWMSNRRPTSSCRVSSKLCETRSGKQPNKNEKSYSEAQTLSRCPGSNIALRHPGVRAPLHHCSTLCTMMMKMMMMTSALMGKRTSVHRRAISDPQVRRTSCLHSLCK